MARSVVYIVSDDPTTVQRARNWANENGYSFQAFNSGQWNSGLENGQFRNQLKNGHVSLAGGSSTGTVVPFPGTNNASANAKVMSMNDMESMAIQNAIAEYKGNLTEAAKALGIGRATLYRKVKQYNIDPSAARNRTPKAA